MLQSLRLKNTNETETKFIYDRIALTEKGFASLCTAFGQYSRKIARIRDKGDELSQTVNEIASNETICKSLSETLLCFANSISIQSDLGDARVNAIEGQVVEELGKYEGICKQAREEAKQLLIAKDKEAQRRRQLERIKERNPKNRQQIIQAETELVKATADVSRTIHDLEQKVISFEKQKIHDIKSIFLDFIVTEMGYHAKILEQLTETFDEVNSMEEDNDLEEFKNRLYKNVPRDTKTFRNAQSVGSINNLFAKKSSDVGNKQLKSKYSKSAEVLNRKSESESESESEDEEDDDDESQTSKTSEPTAFVGRKFLN